MNLSDSTSALAGPSAAQWPTGARFGISGPMWVKDFMHYFPGQDTGIAWQTPGATWMTSMVDALLRRGIPVSLFTTDEALEGDTAPWRLFEAEGLRLYVSPRRRRAFRFHQGRPGRMLDLFRYERDCMAAAMRHDRPHALNAHWSYEYAEAGQVAGLKTLISFHDSPTAILKLTRDAYRLGRWIQSYRVVRRGTHFTVVSPYLKDDLAGWVGQRPNAVIPNPMPAALFARQRVPRSFEQRMAAPRIVMILTGFMERKNPIPAMKALQLFKQHFPAAEFSLIGPGYEPDGPAAAYARAHGMEGLFKLMGRMPHQQALSELAAADLLLHPALEESFGLTLGEAMALGVPIVAGRDSGAVPWVTGGIAGQLVDVRKPDLIETALTALIQDDSAYESAARLGRQRAVSLFSPDSVIQNYIESMATLLGSN